MSGKVIAYEKTEKGVVEHQMWMVDAREACRNDPKRWSLAEPDPMDAPALEPDGKPKAKTNARVGKPGADDGKTIPPAA